MAVTLALLLLSQPRVVWNCPEGVTIRSLHASPCETQMAACLSDGNVVVIDSENGRVLRSAKPMAYTELAIWSTSTPSYVSRYGRNILLQTGSDNNDLMFSILPGRIGRVAKSADDRHLYVTVSDALSESSNDFSIGIATLSVLDGKCLRLLFTSDMNRTRDITGMRVSPNGKHIAIGRDLYTLWHLVGDHYEPDGTPRPTGQVTIVDIVTGESRRQWEIATGSPSLLSYSGDGSILAIIATKDDEQEIGSEPFPDDFGRSLYLFDTDDGDLICRVIDPTGEFRLMDSFGPNRAFAAVMSDGNCNMYDERGTARTIGSNQGEVNCLVGLKRSAAFVTGGKRLCVWTIKDL